MAEPAQHDFWGTLSAVLLMLGGVAVIAVLVSRNANTVGVISATGNAFSNALGVAISPVTGGGVSGSFPIG